jgi:hypothetical protein
MPSSTPKLHERGVVAGLSKKRAPDDPELVAARARLAEARVAEFIERTVADMAPLSPDARARLAVILLRGPSSDTAA